MDSNRIDYKAEVLKRFPQAFAFVNKNGWYVAAKPYYIRVLVGSIESEDAAWKAAYEVTLTIPVAPSSVAPWSGESNGKI